MSGTLKAAILGAGMIGEVHRRAVLLAGAELVGVMASSPSRSAEVAQSWGVAPLADLDAVIASAADVVHVCTPNAQHVPYSVALMRAGKHVICEKPLGVSLADAEQAASVAAETGVVTSMPFAYRFHPMARELRAQVSGDAFGAVNLIHGSYLQDWMLSPASTSWRIDPVLGGPSRAFGDIGSHWCDLAEWVTGDRIAALVATTSVTIPRRPAPTGASFTGAAPGAADEASLVDVQTEDSALILFRTAGGVAGSAVISQLAAGRKNRLWLEVDGAQHSAVFDQERPEELWLGSDEGATVLVRDPNHGSAEQRRLSSLPAGHPMGYAQCFENFVADTYAVVAGEQREGLPTFADGLRAAQICDAMLTSAASGQWVDVAS